ncbi:MAG TPA: hypothetical protein VK327_08065 [Candidatus Paceibacterota bacterium]|nr:hypothetical protein [Candidatus Paceibacterota bacterium]
MPVHHQLIPTRLRNLIGVGLLCLASGCATRSTTGPETDHIFYPPAPQPPRLQFLVSFSNNKDLGGGPGKFATLVAGKEPPTMMIRKPYGLALNQNKLYVCDTAAGVIEVLDLEKRKMHAFAPAGEGQFRTPVNIAIDRDGTRYVADTGRGQVLIYSANESFLGAIGQVMSVNSPDGNSAATNSAAMRKPKTGMKPTDVAVDANRIYVSDLDNHCVRVYAKTTRELLFTIPKDVGDPKAKLVAPTNLTLDSQGRVYASDLAEFCVQEYDAEGKHIRRFGQGAGDRPGEFARPKGVAVDREGRVFIVDAATQVVQMFDAEGNLLLFFGEPKASAAPLELPAKVVVDYDHVHLFQKYAAPGFQLDYLVLVSNQLGNRKVSVYGFGHKQ